MCKIFLGELITPEEDSVSTIFATCCLIASNNFASPDLNRIENNYFQRRRAGTKETTIRYLISSEMFQKFCTPSEKHIILNTKGYH